MDAAGVGGFVRLRFVTCESRLPSISLASDVSLERWLLLTMLKVLRVTEELDEVNAAVLLKSLLQMRGNGGLHRRNFWEVIRRKL